MMPHQTLAAGTRAYVDAVICAGVVVFIHSLSTVAGQPLPFQLLLLAALTLFTGSFTVKLPALSARLSVSEAFVFTSVLLFGTAAGTLIVALDALIISLRLHPEGKSAKRVMFNVAAPVLAIWVASSILYLLLNGRVSPFPGWQLEQFILPLSVATLVYFLLNSGMIAVAIGLDAGKSPFAIWREHFVWLSVNYFGGASVAALIVAYTRDINATVLGVIVPLLIISYLTFRTSIGRLEDAHRHVSQLNNLYMSTVETLAMAIDAKDQITHGHVRRVQSYALALARELGVSDSNQLKAIEAAALLHDTGKLAVPEYILNKPGKLTPAEFSKMQLHAGVGADILSAIPFPYPVVSIVRHHHENWDGSGYPSGLSGSDIPIGARILSVVDCFDALTSDRPYRPRLTNDAAFTILTERRGSMYDPLVVDTFLTVFPNVPISPAAAPNPGIEELARMSRDLLERAHRTPIDDMTAGSGDAQLALEFARQLSTAPGAGKVARLVCQHVRLLIPDVLCVCFVHDERRCEITATHALGPGSEFLADLRIPVGSGLSGWVAANRSPSRNSDPALDFGDAARRMEPSYRSGLSVPVAIGDSLLAVLSVYSTREEAFNDSHRRILERVAVSVAPVLMRLREASPAPTHAPAQAGEH